VRRSISNRSRAVSSVLMFHAPLGDDYGSARRGGRLDLAGSTALLVRAPTLLIVGAKEERSFK
jgi:hypothetical protein